MIAAGLQAGRGLMPPRPRGHRIPDRHGSLGILAARGRASQDGSPTRRIQPRRDLLRGEEQSRGWRAAHPVSRSEGWWPTISRSRPGPPTQPAWCSGRPLRPGKCMYWAETRSKVPAGGGEAVRSWWAQVMRGRRGSWGGGRPGQRHRGDVHGRHPPAAPGQPDRVGAFASADVERGTGCQARRLGDQLGVRLPAPHEPCGRAGGTAHPRTLRRIPCSSPPGPVPCGRAPAAYPV